jgi:hypothetical protein
MSTTGRLKAAASPALAATGGLLTGVAIRNALHHGHAWPWLAPVALVAWAASFALIWVPYRIKRRGLLRERAILLRLQAELNSMITRTSDGNGDKP